LGSKSGKAQEVLLTIVGSGPAVARSPIFSA
jgi:hypothetical protein